MTVAVSAMTHKCYIGIDNGISGSIGCVRDDGELFFAPTPIFKCQDYTQKKQNVSRLDFKKFKLALKECYEGYAVEDVLVILERPMITPGRFKNSISAARCFEAQLVAIETFKLPYMIQDSKQWQASMLPKGISGEDLKLASRDVGCKMFPKFEPMFTRTKKNDADAMLIAAWACKEGL